MNINPEAKPGIGTTPQIIGRKAPLATARPSVQVTGSNRRIGPPRKIVAAPSMGNTPAEIKSIQRHLRGKFDPKALGGGVYAKWAMELRDDKGKPVPIGKDKRGRDIWKKGGASHSFVQNYGIMVRGFLQHLDTALNAHEQITEDDGTFHLIRDKSINTGNVLWAGPAVLKFGAGLGARDATDFDLQGAIMSGLEGVTTFNLVQEVAASSIYEFEAQVQNTTGGLFTIEEMGIFAQLTSNLNIVDVTTLIASDLTGSTAVADTLTVLGRYTFTFAV